MKDIVVEITKGMISGLYCDIEDARFVVVDWDLVERNESGSSVGVQHHHDGIASLPPQTKTEYRRAISS
jgi:hypothetical protein